MVWKSDVVIFEHFELLFSTGGMSENTKNHIH